MSCFPPHFWRQDRFQHWQRLSGNCRLTWACFGKVGSSWLPPRNSCAQIFPSTFLIPRGPRRQWELCLILPQTPQKQVPCLLLKLCPRGTRASSYGQAAVLREIAFLPPTGRTRGWYLSSLTGRKMDNLYNVCTSSTHSHSTKSIISLLQDLVGSKKAFSLFPYSEKLRTSLDSIPSMLPFRLLMCWPKRISSKLTILMPERVFIKIVQMLISLFQKLPSVWSRFQICTRTLGLEKL